MSRAVKRAVGLLGMFVLAYCLWRVFCAIVAIIVGLVTLALAISMFLVRTSTLTYQRWRLEQTGRHAK